MRYASIDEPLENSIKNIPENTTLIRYLFIEDNLFALVLDKNNTDIISLPSEDIKNSIYQLEEYKFDTEKTGILLYELYQKLWHPLENKITNKKIIIIPDRELFNLSFESLVFDKINSFKEFAKKSLLSKYIISYNYSLFLINNQPKKQFFTNNFIAFVPEFNDKMKNDYIVSINDSLSVDKSYLTLLPQPFSVDLAKSYKKHFNGSTFLNKKASKQVFINKANEHKIIHIGTHAESNNLSPDLSRLIFAKNASDENNSLYTYEIYNQNLSSNLAILTACETGKPSYQPGEGMISLAHAFNYAGSESILTSLWEIDEQSSTQIIDFFYTNLSKGLPKDEALQKAKLEYINTAEGRTISPQYWAGLVLIGDVSPLDLTISKPIYLYLIIMAVAFFLFYIFFKRRFKNN